MELATALEAALRELAANPALELRENGVRAASVTDVAWEVRGVPDKPLLHQRACALHPELPLELFEHDHASETFTRVEPRATGNIHSWIVPHRETQTLLDRARPDLDPIVALAPHAIRLHAIVPSKEIWLRFRGLPFAHWKDGGVFFGLKKPWETAEP